MSDAAAVPAMPVQKRVEAALGTLALRAVVGPVRRLPLARARRVGRALGAVTYMLMRRYRRVAIQNLTMVYGGDWDPGTIRSTARGVFRHFGQVAAEFVKMPALTLDEVCGLADVHGREHLDGALARGKGVLIITGHFGNWEFLSRWLCLSGYPLHVVMRRARNPEATVLLEQTRTGGGANVLLSGGSARPLLRALHSNELVGILPDQNAADVFVPFFGQSTGTVDGPAVIHLKTGAPMVFSWATLTEDGRYRLDFEPPLYPEPHSDTVSVTTEVNRRLEARVRTAPEQWLWLHDRWRASREQWQEKRRA